jgi:hypothetical protein
MSLGVMHQLHCLNWVRKNLYPDRYHPLDGLTKDMKVKYMEHTGKFHVN